ncbi:MAG: deoxyribose-phosphate aldolase [Clostridiales bacterium]|jgi:deoxyribose-phosphate aldolase|nr:deoxyribose-phosphate aldolase [Clostridiales bacterium]
MDKQVILSKCDHTLLAPDATWERIKKLIVEATEFRTASVCIPPSFAARAAAYAAEVVKGNAAEYTGSNAEDLGDVFGKADFYLNGSADEILGLSQIERDLVKPYGKIPVCTVVGFPNGYSVASVKAAETEAAISDGADEIDVVINIGDVKDGSYIRILNELSLLKRICGNKILKVIIETCLLTDAEKIEMCKIVSDSGADFIKTSTGFGAGGAALSDVELFKRHLDAHVKIKAAGGIRTLEAAQAFIGAGADRVGASALINACYAHLA